MLKNKKYTTNNNGFAVWPLLLVIVLAAIVFVGWRVTSQNKTAQDNNQAEDWETYSNQELGISMQHPADWSIEFSDADTESTLYIAVGGVSKPKAENDDLIVGALSVLRHGDADPVADNSGTDITICGKQGKKTIQESKYIYVVNLENAVFSASAELKSLGSNKPAVDLPSEADVETLESILAGAECNVPSEVATSAYPSDWLEYRAVYSSESDLTFHAPRSWGPLETASFDDSGNYFYLQFPKMGDKVKIGAPEPDYTTPGRGGTLTDVTSFEVRPDGVYTEAVNSTSFNEQPGYVTLPDAKSEAVFNNSVDFFEETYRHGIVKTQDRTSVINFVVEAGLLTPDEFRLLLTSVDIQ